jgi:phosphatidate cytidylyltransferase
VLKQRLLTIAILLPLFVWSVVVLPTRYFAVLIAFIVLIAAWEWTSLMRLEAWNHRLAYLALVLVTMLSCTWLAMIPGVRQLILSCAVLWWLWSLMLIRQYESNPRQLQWLVADAKKGHFHPPWLLGMLGLVVLVPAWLSLLILHGSALPGNALVLLLLSLVWAADSGAYVAGRLWGKKKLAPHVSPGKTWAGLYGGLMAGTAVIVIGGLWIGFGWKTQVSLILLGLVAVLFSVIGDLFESLIKRIAGVKDSGHLLPGHGGVLDRIDSVTAAAPLFTLGLLWQGIIP